MSYIAYIVPMFIGFYIVGVARSVASFDIDR